MRRVRRRVAALGAAGTVGVLLAACSVSVPDPAAPTPAVSEPALATPTITPGHDAAAVAAKDLPLDAGGTLAAGDPVTLGNRLEEVPGWSVVHSGLQGENKYKKTDGCMAVARVAVNQGPLVVPGDDAASTKALFAYLDAGTAAENLKPVKLPWGQDTDGPQRQVEFLALESPGTSGGQAMLVWARLFSKPASSVYVSLACPDADALATSKAELAGHVAVIPPGQ